MKLAVIGGGSTYTPELIDGILRRRDRLPISEIVLCDIDQGRLEIVAAFARRMVEAGGGGIDIHESGEAADAVRGARFVVSQFRVGGQAARHRDEMLGREFGLIGQETVGVGGFAKGLRTIPVALELAEVILREAPAATLLNFTNPAGMITEALLQQRPQLQTIGLCNVPWNLKTEITARLAVPSDEVELDYVGLNHLSWVRGVRVGDRDLTGAALGAFRQSLDDEAGADDHPQWTKGAVDVIGAIPNYYLLYYFEPGLWLQHQASHPTRAADVMTIEAALLERYSDPDLVHKPDELMQRGGAYYSDSAAQLMADIVSDARTTHVVNTRHGGAVAGMPADVVMETPCIVGAGGPQPVPAQPLRADVDALVRTVKDFELLTIEAAVNGDEDAALRALLTNPLGPDLSMVHDLWNRLKEEHRGLLGALDA